MKQLTFKGHKNVVCHNCGRFIGEDGPNPQDLGPIDEGKKFRYSMQCWSCDRVTFYNLEDDDEIRWKKLMDRCKQAIENLEAMPKPERSAWDVLQERMRKKNEQARVV
jgi:hypothetical protein